MIVLAGQNNFCPQFSQFGYSQNISEGLPPGQVVLVTAALDGDTGASGVVDYAIIGEFKYIQLISYKSDLFTCIRWQSFGTF